MFVDLASAFIIEVYVKPSDCFYVIGPSQSIPNLLFVLLNLIFLFPVFLFSIHKLFSLCGPVGYIEPVYVRFWG